MVVPTKHRRGVFGITGTAAVVRQREGETMRRAAYIKAIQQARGLPTSISELAGYFTDPYNPRLEALAHILKKARRDTDGLFDGEFVEIMQASQ